MPSIVFRISRNVSWDYSDQLKMEKVADMKFDLYIILHKTDCSHCGWTWNPGDAIPASMWRDDEGEVATIDWYCPRCTKALDKEDTARS